LQKRARHENEKEEIRNAIFRAAVKIIADEGYDKLSMRKIASAIDYTPTTIYSYYRDKAQIVDDISRQIYRKIVGNIKIALEKNSHLPLDDQLRVAFREFMFSITSDPEMGVAVIRSGTKAIFRVEGEPELLENNGILILHSLLVQGQKENIFRRLDYNISWMLITALIGFSINAIENQFYLDKNWGDLIDTYSEMLISGLLA